MYIKIKKYRCYFIFVIQSKYIMTIQEFRKAINMGLGSAILELKKMKPMNFIEMLFYMQ